MLRVVRIEGMHCEHCYTRVSNLLNSMEGVSAVVKGRKGIAVVRMEKLHSDEEIEQAITDMGYSVLSISGK